MSRKKATGGIAVDYPKWIEEEMTKKCGLGTITYIETERLKNCMDMNIFVIR